MKDFKIGQRTIGSSHPVFVIAELACAHDGKVEIGKAMIDAAIEAKADAVNFQITHLPDYMVPHYGGGKGRVSAGKDDTNIYGYLQKILLDFTEWEALFVHAREKGIAVACTCNDHASLEFAARFNPDLYTISAACVGERQYLGLVASQGKPICIRAGGSTLGELEEIVLTLREHGAEDIVLVHGFQSYPTRLEHMNLAYMKTLRDTFGLQVGFADHIDGGEELAVYFPIMALPYGATVIEKHITHDREARCEDFESALGAADFKKFMDVLRRVETSVGSPYARSLSEAEGAYRQVCRKRAVAAKDLKAGEVLNEADVAYKRSDEGLFPGQVSPLFGRKLTRDVSDNEPIGWTSVN